MKTLQEGDQEARKVVDGWTTGAALTGWIPGSAFFLAGGDLVMIKQVADAYEVSAYDMDHLKTTLGGVVGGAVAGGVISEVVGLIPVVGLVVKSGAMAAKAKVLGQAIIEYFRVRSTLINPNAEEEFNEAEDAFAAASKAYESAKADWDRAEADWKTAKQTYISADSNHSDSETAYTKAENGWEKAKVNWKTAESTWNSAQETFIRAKLAFARSK